MSRKQMKFLEHPASEIPKLLEMIRQGNYFAETLLGTRNIDGKVISLKTTARLENLDEDKEVYGSTKKPVDD